MGTCVSRQSRHGTILKGRWMVFGDRFPHGFLACYRHALADPSANSGGTSPFQHAGTMASHSVRRGFERLQIPQKRFTHTID